MINPKEKFKNSLLNIVSNFEEETGVEIKNIHFERINTSKLHSWLDISQIIKIQFDLK